MSVQVAFGYLLGNNTHPSGPHHQDLQSLLFVSEGKSNRVYRLPILRADGGKKLCIEKATPLVKLPDLQSLLHHYK